MAEAFNLLRRVKSLDISPEQPAYSGVVIFAGQDEEGNNIEYSAGDRTGTVLEITNEWGSQEQADAIYRKLRGFQYQPYRATGSQLDPSVELGDAVTVKDTYGGVFKKTISFGRYASTDIEAPSKEEVEHEFQIQSPTNRQYERFTRSVRASLSITASQIAAEVEDRKAEDNLLTIELTGAWTQFTDFSIPGGRGYIYADSNNDLHVGLVTNNTVTVEWVALYEGEYTAETLPEYHPKGYGAELAECQRYYQIRSANNIAAVDMRPTMRLSSPTITSVTGGYAYSADL